MAFVLALIHPGLSPDRDRKLAFGFYSLLAALPTAAIVYGSVRRRPVVSVVAWKVLLLETAAIMRG